MTSKQFTREDLINKLFPYHGLIPTDAINEIEANERAKCDKLIDNQMKEISRLQVLAEKQGKEIAQLNKMIVEFPNRLDEIAGLKKSLSDKDYTIKTASDVITNRNTEIASLKELVKDATTLISDVQYDDRHEYSPRQKREWLAKAKQAIEIGRHIAKNRR